MGLKDKKDKKVTLSLNTVDEGKVCFSFEYLTKNKNYNFDYFRDKTDKLTALEDFISKVKEISCVSLKECQRRGKILGCESIPVSNFLNPFRQILKNIDIIYNNNKLIVIRFSQNKYRLICKSSVADGNMLYIIGFDFNHSAYNHG